MAIWKVVTNDGTSRRVEADNLIVRTGEGANAIFVLQSGKPASTVAAFSNAQGIYKEDLEQR